MTLGEAVLKTTPSSYVKVCFLFCFINSILLVLGTKAQIYE